MDILKFPTLSILYTCIFYLDSALLHGEEEKEDISVLFYSFWKLSDII